MPARSATRPVVSLAVVTHPASRRALACLLAVGAATVGALVPAAPSTAAAAPGGRTPLRVSLQSVTPAVIPRSGAVTLTGVVTNRSKETWTDLKVYLLTSSDPIRSRSELAGQAASGAAAEVGNRVTGTGLYDVVGDLAPGRSAPYRVSVPRAQLGISGDPGVYWVGVHVLGAVDGVRDRLADGRARTFMPLMPATVAAPTRLALVVPLEQAVHRGADTRLLQLRSWQRMLRAGGRLNRLLALSGRADQPLTWLVDPAVLDAARSVAGGNPGLDEGPDPTADGGSGAASPSASSSPSAGRSDSDGTGDSGGTGTAGSGDQAAPGPSPAAVAARAWLTEFRSQAGRHTVSALPYGDLDVASALSSELPHLYPQATALSRNTLADLGVPDAGPVVSPRNGYLPQTVLRRLSPDSTAILDSRAVPGAPGPVLEGSGRAPVVLADAAAGGGGPRPNPRYTALAVRQRLLSEAALHALSSDRGQPLVVSTPRGWDPGPAWSRADFFAALHQPWLRLVDLPGVVSGPAAAGSAGAVRTTAAFARPDRAPRVPVENLLATEDLVLTGRAYAGLLSANDTVEDALARTAMLASSENARRDPVRPRVQAIRTADFVRNRMSKVRLEGPPFVMMSGESGPILVTLVNGLDQPVTVGVRTQTSSSDLSIAEIDPVTLGPGRRTALRLHATSHDIGVHPVTLEVTTADGTPLGSRAQLTVRTSHVSTVIWLIMGVGGGVLFLAIAVRLVRRIRRRKSTHGPLLPREPAPTGGRQPDQELNA
jgi:Family of unknown function (DUF6049)